jgi:hypothetical protein
MRNTRWLATTGYTLYSPEEKEYIFYLDQEDDDLSKNLTYREMSEGVEWLDENGRLIFTPWDFIETEIE